MEIGNLVFGCSRGEHAVERDRRWEDALYQLSARIDPSYEREPGIAAFENKVFELRPYYWGDCSCGFDGGFDEILAQKRAELGEEAYGSK